MEIVFPSLDSPPYQNTFGDAVAGIESLKGLFERHRIEGGGTPPEDPTGAFEEALGALNRLLETFQTLGVYTRCALTTNTRDALAQARNSELNLQTTELRKLQTRFIAWIGSLDVDALLGRSAIAREHEYALRKAQIQAGRLMAPSEEALAADLSLTGTTAWSQLHSDVSSQLEVRVRQDGEERALPMSAVRGMASEPDRETRRAAYEAELAAWQSVEVPLATALNSIKGEVGTLAKRRGWGSPLDEALFGANIDREALEAMLLAARESFPAFRRYLRAKAKALGVERLAWFDIFAPLGDSPRQWTLDEACDFVAEHFGAYSEKMREFALRSYRENWIDWPATAGKVDGAYCASLRRDESRILMNWRPSFNTVSTLAHELGHGYHNLCLNGRTPLQRQTPMTLAETASIFCETIAKRAALQVGDASERLAILEGSLQGFNQVVVDITSRYLFEQSVFEGRAARSLSPAELCERMLDAQRQTYGDGLDPDLLHPYMWAAKGHYYASRSFYNFPYMFGLLFGLGLYAQYEAGAEDFQNRYDDLLSSTGLADAATLGERFGIDIRTPDFWRASLRVIEKDIESFEKAVG